MTRRTTTPTSSGSGTPKATMAPGWVSIVGAGPGDPSLLTVRAVELIRTADVVVTEVPAHDELVRSLTDAPEIVDGGFGDQGQVLTAAARAKVVVKAAKAGRRVVRLLVGDPFLDASGPEEAKACVKAGIGFDIVPGVAAATAVPAYAGIPLTTKEHRDVAVVSAAGRVDWRKYVDPATLVVLSADDKLPDIALALADAGRDPETPVAVTSSGTTTDQQTVVSTLASVAKDVRDARLTAPT